METFYIAVAASIVLLAFTAWLAISTTDALAPSDVRSARAYNRKVEKLYREKLRHRRAMSRIRRNRRNRRNWR